MNATDRPAPSVPGPAGTRDGEPGAPADALRLLRASLAAVWLGTAVTSLLQAQGRSRELLDAAGFTAGPLADAALAGGVALDAVIGLLLVFAPRRLAAGAALAGLALMTLATTLVLPGAWLDPLGSLLKNLPIAAALWLLWRQEPR